LLAGSHASVKPLGDDIGHCIVDEEFDLDVRILPQELLKFRPQDCVDGIFGGRDPNGAGRLLAKLAYGREFGIDLFEPRTHSA
jgi:hypothetical protein